MVNGFSLDKNPVNEILSVISRVVTEVNSFLLILVVKPPLISSVTKSQQLELYNGAQY